MEQDGKISESSSLKLEKIYDRTKRAILCADSKCCKVRKGDFKFSEEIKILSGRILVLKLIKKETYTERKTQ